MRIGPQEKFLGKYYLTTHAKLGLGKYFRRLERYYYRGFDDIIPITEHDTNTVMAMCVVSISEMIEKHRRTQIVLSVVSTVLRIAAIVALVWALLK